MKERLVHDLVCPLSAEQLRLEMRRESGEIDNGALVCDGCGARWPVAAGVPRLVPHQGDEQRETAAAFGWEWQHFSEMHPEFEPQFLDWLHPITPDFFQGKRVLDAGCGTGRHAYLAAAYGAEEVVAFDLSDAVETAQHNLKEFDNVHVMQADMLRLPLRTAADGGGFDFIYSIGVLHHLPIPYEGFRALVRYLRPGGRIAVWVYGHEGNGVVRGLIDPIRRVSAKIPPSVLRPLTLPLALGFHGVAKGVYRPLAGTQIGRRLPLNEYLSSVADFSFRQNHAIVFDQLVAPTTHYIKGPELKRWFAETALEDVHISHRHGNSWRGQGRTPSA